MKKLSIAIYSYNFGNYRDEIFNQKFHMVQGCDHYFFTDIPSIELDGWNIIPVNLLNSVNGISAERVTSKYYKFIYTHPCMRNYKYLLHIDCSIVNRLENVRKDELIKLINSEPNAHAIYRVHPQRKNTSQEINVIQKIPNIQPSNKLYNYCNSNIVKNKKYDMMLLPALGIFIRKRQSLLLQLGYKRVFKILCQYGIWRDQIVFCPIMYWLWKFKLIVISDNYLRQVSYGCWGVESNGDDS